MPLMNLGDTSTIVGWAFFILLTLVALVTVPPIGVAMAIGLVIAVVASVVGAGDQRAQAGWRIVAGAWIITVGAVIGFGIIVVATLWGVADIIIQGVFDRNILSESTSAAQAVAMTFNWGADQAIFATTGGGSQSFHPVPKQSMA